MDGQWQSLGSEYGADDERWYGQCRAWREALKPLNIPVEIGGPAEGERWWL